MKIFKITKTSQVQEPTTRSKRNKKNISPEIPTITSQKKSTPLTSEESVAIAKKMLSAKDSGDIDEVNRLKAILINDLIGKSSPQKRFCLQT